MDPERVLVLAYVPATRRAAVEALWRLDVVLGSVLVTGMDPMISRIRLAWWRESLEKLDLEPPPGEPVLEALATHVLPAGVSGAALAAIEEGWSALLAEGPLDAQALQTYAEARGGLLFRHSARLLGAEGEVETAGANWALVDLARRSTRPSEAAAALKAATEIAHEPAWPRALRPLAMLSLLARRDVERHPLPLERQGAPARMLRLLKYRLVGR